MCCRIRVARPHFLCGMHTHPHTHTPSSPPPTHPKTQHKHKQNQDLFALGIGNMLSACFSTFVAAGSFGRTALAQVDECGKWMVTGGCE